MATTDPHQPAAPSEPPPLQPRSSFGGFWFVVSAIALGLVVLLLVLVIATTDGGGSDDNPAAGPSPSVPSASSSGEPAAGDGQCPALSDNGTQIPQEAPEGVTWSVFRTMALPASSAAGPAVVEGDVARCYAHSPAGALLAAAQISTRYAFAKDWRSVVEQQTYGEGKQPLIDARAKTEKTNPMPDPVPGELGQFAGFKFVTYSPQTAVVELVTRHANGALQVSVLTLRWEAGDWQFELPLNGAPPKSTQTLAGYVPWGGV